MRLSVIFSTRNRADSLDQTLAGLARQEGLSPDDWEIIVIDNGSTDSTPDVLAKWSSRLPLIPMVEPTPGKNRALNRAVDIARGELFVFTDDDVDPEPDWIRQMWEGAARWPDDNLFGGRIVPRFPPETPDFIGTLRFRYARNAFSWYELDEPEGPVSTPPFGPNLAIRASVFRNGTRYCESIGPAGTNYAMGSETEILVRLNAEGMRFIHLPEAKLEHIIASKQVTLEWLKGRAYRAGRGQSRVDTEIGIPYLFNVPRYLWFRVVRKTCALLAANFRDRETRWTVAMDLQRLWGTIHEYRLMAREAASWPPEMKQKVTAAPE